MGIVPDRVVEVYCSLQFEGIHCWPGCPIPEVHYLSVPHRHMFHVKAYSKVNHNDRDVEFIKLKHDITKFLYEVYPHDTESASVVLLLGANSCEMIANKILNQFNLSRCEVNEDGENGAIVTRLYDVGDNDRV